MLTKITQVNPRKQFAQSFVSYANKAMQFNVEYYKEQLDAKEDMLVRTTGYLVGTQQVLEQKNHELTEIQREIFQSVSFAKIIQNSLQPDIDILKIFFSDASYKVLQQIGIGGDCIFIKSTNSGVFFGLLDATGHGIPAAMLSISGVLILNELTHSLSLENPKALLELLNYRLYNTFNRDNLSVAHFEGTVLHYSYITRKLTYCSANGKAFYITKNGIIQQIPVSKTSVGENLQSEIKTFDLPFEKGDKLMLFSDGLVDQFGGEQNRKYMSRRLKTLLETHYHQPVNELTNIILNDHKQWKGNHKQTDDVSFKLIEF